MQMQMLKPILLVIIAGVYLFFNFIPNSEAIRIVEMNPSHSAEVTSSGGVNYHTAYVRTTENLDSVQWYVDGDLVHTSVITNDATEAYFSPHWLTGNLQGNRYIITAIAISDEDDDNDGNPDTDSRSYELIVWEI